MRVSSRERGREYGEGKKMRVSSRERESRGRERR